MPWLVWTKLGIIEYVIRQVRKIVETARDCAATNLRLLAVAETQCFPSVAEALNWMEFMQ